MGLTIANVDLGTRMHASWSDDPGGQHMVTGHVTASGPVAFQVAMAQFMGIINNPDEQAVAVVPSQDSSRTGYYRVLDGHLDLSPSSLRNYSAPARLSLEALPSRYTPLIESRIYGTLRVNDHSIAKGTTVPWWASPIDATMDYTSTTTATRAGESGSVKVGYNTSGATYYDDTFGWQCLAADYYDGAAVLEVTSDGVTWVRLPGLRTGAASAASAYGWRLNNGLVRVVYGGSAGTLSVQHYISSAWVTAKTYKITYSSSGTAIGDWKAISILRNDPACVTIRLSAELSSTYPAQVNVDVSLRRGALWIDCVATKDSSVVSVTGTELGVFRTSAEAATAHTSGIHATSADAAGHKYILTTSKTKTNDLTNGGMYVATSVQVFPFMIGYEPSGASGPDTFTNQVYSWFAATREYVRFSRR